MAAGWHRLCDDEMFLNRMTEETIHAKTIVLPNRFLTKMLSKVKSLHKLILDVHSKGCFPVHVRKVRGSHCIVDGWAAMVSGLNLTTSHTLIFHEPDEQKLKVILIENEFMDLFSMFDNPAVIPLPADTGNGRGRSLGNSGETMTFPRPDRAWAKFTKTAEVTHTKYHKMAVPRKFMTTYAAKLCEVEVWKLKVKGNNARTWFVNISVYEGKGYLHGGWNEFVRSNSIQVGDRYEFKVIKWESPVLPMQWKK